MKGEDAPVAAALDLPRPKRTLKAKASSTHNKGPPQRKPPSADTDGLQASAEKKARRNKGEVEEDWPTSPKFDRFTDTGPSPAQQGIVADWQSTIMASNSVDEVLASRVRPSPSGMLTCGYCHKSFTRCPPLRTHIAAMPDHLVYIKFLILRHLDHEPLPPEGSDTYFRIPGIHRVSLHSEASIKTSKSRPQNPHWTWTLHDAEQDGQDGSGLVAGQEVHVAANKDTGYMSSDAQQSWLDVLQDTVGADLHQALRHANIHALLQCGKDEQILWNSACGMPVLTSSKRCYATGTAYDDRSLFVECDAVDFANVTMWVNGAVTPAQSLSSRRRLFAELKYGYRLSRSLEDCLPISAGISLRDEDRFCVPSTASQPIAQYEDSVEVILSPCGGFTDLHIDHGSLVVAAPVEQCRKIFLLWPPTPHNLAIFDGSSTSGARLLHLCTQLEGGLMTELTSENALIMPPGVLHAVFTLEGGFLIGKTYLTAVALIPMSRWLAGNPSYARHSDAKTKQAMVQRWINAASLVDAGDVVEAWKIAASTLATLLQDVARNEKRCWLQLTKRLRTERLLLAGDVEEVNGMEGCVDTVDNLATAGKRKRKIPE